MEYVHYIINEMYLHILQNSEVLLLMSFFSLMKRGAKPVLTTNDLH